MNEKEIDISKLLKAQQVFERFRIDMEDDRDKAGAIQAFEFCYELAWKMMRRILNIRGLEMASPKETFRKAAIEKLINDPEIWFEFQKMRNLTSHTYESENLDQIVGVFDVFSLELNNFVQTLKDI